jgi:hypothetical protein
VAPEIHALPSPLPATARPATVPVLAPPAAQAEAPVRRQVVRDVVPPVQPLRKRRAAAPASVADGAEDPPATEKWNDPFE